MYSILRQQKHFIPKMSNGNLYIVLRTDGRGHYYLGSTYSDPYDDDERVRNYDRMLHQALTTIFVERCLTSDEIKSLLLRTPENTRQDSIFKLILERKPALADIFPRGNDSSLLWIVVLSYYQNSAELLVRSGADVNELYGLQTICPFGKEVYEKWTVLHALLQMYPSLWNEQFICLLTHHGANLAARDFGGERTCLHFAVKEGRVKVAEYFLEKGADVDAVNYNGTTPLLAAATTSAAVELLPLLIKHGADVTARDTVGRNILHYLSLARQKDAVALARVFIEKGVPLDNREHLYDGYQPIHQAAISGKNKLVKVFLDHGADLHALSTSGMYPLYLAARCSKPKVLLTLLEHGANVNQQMERRGRTALHSACNRSNVEIIKILLFYRADILVEDRHRRTPFATIPRGDLRSPSIRLMMRALALKKDCLQPSIELKDERIINAHPMLLDYYRDCRARISRMKSKRFIESCTFYELLTKCYCQTALLMRNLEFESKFRLYDLSIFCMYAKDILEAFERAKRYYLSTLEQEDVINEAAYYTLPHIVVRKVARYALQCTICDNSK